MRGTREEKLVTSQLSSQTVVLVILATLAQAVGKALRVRELIQCLCSEPLCHHWVLSWPHTPSPSPKQDMLQLRWDKVTQACVWAGIQLRDATEPQDMCPNNGKAWTQLVPLLVLLLLPPFTQQSQLSLFCLQMLDPPRKKSLDVYDVAFTSIPQVVIKLCRTWRTAYARERNNLIFPDSVRYSYSREQHA